MDLFSYPLEYGDEDEYSVYDEQEMDKEDDGEILPAVIANREPSPQPASPRVSRPGSPVRAVFCMQLYAAYHAGCCAEMLPCCCYLSSSHRLCFFASEYEAFTCPARGGATVVFLERRILESNRPVGTSCDCAFVLSAVDITISDLVGSTLLLWNSYVLHVSQA